jgi:hypothetical protein
VDGGRVFGRVVDSCSGQPFNGFVVVPGFAAVWTRQDGYFDIRHLPSGNFTLGYLNVTQPAGFSVFLSEPGSSWNAGVIYVGNCQNQPTCGTPGVCAPHQECSDSAGGPVCGQCEPGYAANGSACIQIPQCPAGFNYCGNFSCNNLANDINNCGACGNVCAPGASACMNGVCAYPGNGTPGGNVTPNCPAGSSFDGVKCVVDTPGNGTPGGNVTPHCPAGTVFDGTKCATPPPVTCPAGFYASGNICVPYPPGNVTPTNNSGNFSGGELPVDAAPEDRDAAMPDMTLAGGALALFWALNRRRYTDG